MKTSLKLWQNKKGRYFFRMPTKNAVFFLAASCKKDIFLVGMGVLNKFRPFLFHQGFIKYVVGPLA